jgi:hypothetical protein
MLEDHPLLGGLAAVLTPGAPNALLLESRRLYLLSHKGGSPSWAFLSAPSDGLRPQVRFAHGETSRRTSWLRSRLPQVLRP